MNNVVSGFSKLSKEEKINWITSTYFTHSSEAKSSLLKYLNSDEELQKLHDEFIENALTNFYLPYGVAPNFIINGKSYTIPMVIEESSVVAAASKAAKFWGARGGFKTSIISTEKIGQVHFIFKGNLDKLNRFFKKIKPCFFDDSSEITKNMQKRGGGILDIELRDKTSEIENYYQLHATFDTKDSMGANFINTCLEQFAKTLEIQANNYESFSSDEKNIQIVLICILTSLLVLVFVCILSIFLFNALEIGLLFKDLFFNIKTMFAKLGFIKTFLIDLKRMIF
jgi:hydroxymethylglutaryl-CoA reductase